MEELEEFLRHTLHKKARLGRGTVSEGALHNTPGEIAIISLRKREIRSRASMVSVLGEGQAGRGNLQEGGATRIPERAAATAPY